MSNSLDLEKKLVTTKTQYVCRLALTAVSYREQFGTRSGRQIVGPDLDPNSLTLVVLLKKFEEKIIISKQNQQTTTYANYPVGKESRDFYSIVKD